MMVALAKPRPAGASTPEIPTCTVLIVNEVTGTVEQRELPESVDEALENCVVLTRICAWLEWHPEQDGPLEVSLRKTETTIVVQFVPVGDQEDAEEALDALLNGERGATP